MENKHAYQKKQGCRSYKQKPHFPFTFSDLQLFNGGLQKSHDMFVACPHMRERLALLSYMKYHNEVRTHLSLEKDAPVSRAVERAGRILCRPILGGLHPQYVRI